MTPVDHLQPSIFVIFGFAGDLSWRKLYPALYDLFREKHLPEQFAILGVGHLHDQEEVLRQKLKKGVDQFSRLGPASDEVWSRFNDHLAFLNMELETFDSFLELAKKLADLAKDWLAPVNHIFYLALPPKMIEIVVHNLAKAKLNRDHRHVRLVVEKPFGHDLESAQRLNSLLGGVFKESQIFRIDHYLGKETVQNIFALRFANTLFEPVWNRHYIDQVQITVAESVGVERRGHYYDGVGALRDMIQNHLLQVLCLIAMEPPISFEADEVRNKKLDVLKAIRPIRPEQVSQCAVRGQYGRGWPEGEHNQAYRAEEHVSPQSSTETFAALKLFVDNWRWQDVPFYLRTGKRLPARISEVAVQFRPVPHQTFPASAAMDWQPNRLLIAIQPEEGILLRFEAKYPGLEMRLAPVIMQFYYREAFKEPSPEAYETLLLDIIQGDTTLFMRADQAEAAWSVISPILDVWQNIEPMDFPNYQSGTWGPEDADALIAQDGHSWIMPTILSCDEDIARCRVLSEIKP